MSTLFSIYGKSFFSVLNDVVKFLKDSWPVPLRTLYKQMLFCLTHYKSIYIYHQLTLKSFKNVYKGYHLSTKLLHDN